MQPGDATIAMYHIPHGGTRNENGNSARKSPIFTLVNKKRQPNKVIEGHSDHPDREWEGMQHIVAEERAKEGKSNTVFEL